MITAIKGTGATITAGTATTGTGTALIIVTGGEPRTIAITIRAGTIQAPTMIVMGLILATALQDSM